VQTRNAMLDSLQINNFSTHQGQELPNHHLYEDCISGKRKKTIEPPFHDAIQESSALEVYGVRPPTPRDAPSVALRK
jgi:hypothetical protein